MSSRLDLESRAVKKRTFAPNLSIITFCHEQ
jgi:hypothetical protein